jgi:hypothetical protein
MLLGSVAKAQQAPFTFSPLPLDPQLHRVVYTATVPVANTSQDQLFSRAQQWFRQATTTYKASVNLIRPETSDLQMRGNLKSGRESFNFRLSVTAKDNYYVYRLDNITYTPPNYVREGKYSREPTPVKIETLVYTRPKKSRDKKLTEIDLRLKRILQDLNNTMQLEPAGLATQW